MVFDDYTRHDNPRIRQVVEENQEEIAENEELYEKMLVAAWGDLSERFKTQFESMVLDGAEESIEECDEILGRGEESVKAEN